MLKNGEPVCVVCHDRRVKHEHVICRGCNEREHYGMLSEKEEKRLVAEIQYRRDNP